MLLKYILKMTFFVQEYIKYDLFIIASTFDTYPNEVAR